MAPKRHEGDSGQMRFDDVGEEKNEVNRGDHYRGSNVSSDSKLVVGGKPNVAPGSAEGRRESAWGDLGYGSS